MTTAPHPRFSVQGHILSTGGNALRLWMSSLLIINPKGFAFLATFCHSRAPSKFMFTKHSLGFSVVDCRLCCNSCVADNGKILK
jgi:hypothetical protein